MLAVPTLLAISSRGNVFQLTSRDGEWEQVANQSLSLQGFKKVAATPCGVWGLGCDHQVYVYVPASDLPIRCQEVTYENERWIPTRGWSGSNMLPLDPWNWSSEDCQRHLPKEDFKLPSEAWTWESDWYVDENVQGFLTDKGITSIHVDPLEEPVVEVVVGGYDLPYQPEGTATVWAVTINGRLFWRGGVNRLNPEGSCWQEMDLGEDHEVLGVGAGPTGLLWALTWGGMLLVRKGVTWQNPTGSSWLEVAPPDERDRVAQVALGRNSVWVTAGSGKVWFRKGVAASQAGQDDQAVTGTGWVPMVHRMKALTVGPYDQVWGIDYDDRQIYFRRGVTKEEQTGKTWAMMDLPYHTVQNRSCSLSTRASHNTSEAGHGLGLPVAIVTDTQEDQESPINSEESNGTCSAGTADLNTLSDSESSGQGQMQGHNANSTDNCLYEETDSSLTSVSSALCSESMSEITSSESSVSVSSPLDPLDEHDNGTSPATSAAIAKKPMLSKSKTAAKFLHKNVLKGFKTVKSVSKKEIGKIQSQLDHVLHGPKESENSSVTFNLSSGAVEMTFDPRRRPSNGSVSNSDVEMSAGLSVGKTGLSSSMTSLDIEDSLEEGPDNFIAEEGDILWVCVSASTCDIKDENEVRQWFLPNSGTQKSLALYQRQVSQGGWRSLILSQLQDRNQSLWASYSHIDLAIDRSVWSKLGKLRWWQDLERGNRWIDVKVEVTQDMDPGSRAGCFTIEYDWHSQKKHLLVPLHDIVAVCVTQESRSQPTFCLYTPERLTASPRSPPIKLVAPGEEELENWVADLSVVCCEQRGLRGAPGRQVAWAILDHGDVFVHQPLAEEGHSSAPNRFWHQLGGHLAKVESCLAGITWGIGHDCKPWCYTGGYGGGFFKGVASSTKGIHVQTDHRDVYIYENQRWRPVLGFTDKFLIRDWYSWSEQNAREESSKDGYKLSSRHWAWVSDWQVDHGTQSGVDKDGWFYGYDFKAKKFYPRPRFRSYVRRRRWVRRYCVTTSGPWEEVNSVPLLDISLQVASSSQGSYLAVWAIGLNGDVLCRQGVTHSNPKGNTWQHVATDLPFSSVSVASDLTVWATAQDGSAWVRTGVAPDCPTGTCWFHVAPPPKGSKLQQISVGSDHVWAIDQNKVAWVRTGQNASCPEGQTWRWACNHILHVSMGNQDQVWAVVEQVSCKGGPLNGVVAERTGVSADCPQGSGWDYGVGGGWRYVSARGLAT